MNIKLFLISILIFVFFKSNSQITIPGIPESFNLKNKAALVIPASKLEYIDTAKLRVDDFNNGINNRYAIAKKLNINFKNEGVKTEIIGKGNIWQYKLQSPATYSLGIQFNRFKLPKGASIFLYNESHSEIIGAFTGLNNNSTDQLQIQEFPGNNATIEYFEPINPEFSGELTIGYVLQAYRNMEALLTTDIGINCTNGSDWQTQKRAICRITFVDNLTGYFCSGSLINNTKNDEKPYFLTANHCVSSNLVAKTMVFYFNFEAKNCGDTTSIKPWQTLSGATLIATNSTSDFTLTLLSSEPPLSYSVYFAGWDISGNIPKNGTCIHQPGGRSKCIAIDNNGIASNSQSLTWQDDKGRIISTSKISSHWQVQFDIGSVEGGSSGSPLFNEKKRIVGQLHGGQATVSYFGKLNLSMNSSTLSQQQLAVWLDPTNTGVQVLDGIDSKNVPVAEFSAPITKVCIATPIQFNDLSQLKPIKWHWSVKPATIVFVNSTDSSENPQISFLNEGQYSISLTAVNSNGSNSITHTNYITASNIYVKFNKFHNDTSICGYEIQNFHIVASGASKYTFSTEPSQKFYITSNFDTVSLTLKNEVKIEGSFKASIRVLGEQGSCSASDSVNFNIVIPPNDDISNSISLKLGENGPYSNNCATVETLEPHPITSGCFGYINSWCTGAVLNNTIWFSFIGPPNGKITLDTHGFDDRIAIYEASSSYDIFSGNTSIYKIIAANDNRSETDVTAYLQSVNVIPGKKYWLQLDGYNGASGNCIIDLFSNNIEIYPNPNNGKFNFAIYEEGGTSAIVEIFTSSGQLVFSKKVNYTIQSSLFMIDLPTLTSGLYLIKVNTENNTYSKKILIVR